MTTKKLQDPELDRLVQELNQQNASDQSGSETIPA